MEKNLYRYNKVNDKGVNKMNQSKRIFILFALAILILGVGYIDLMIAGNNESMVVYHFYAGLCSLVACFLTLRESFRAVSGN